MRNLLTRIFCALFNYKYELKHTYTLISNKDIYYRDVPDLHGDSDYVYHGKTATITEYLP